MYQVQWHICEDNTDMKLQWNQIDWKKAEEQVNRLQIRIVKATLEQKLRLVKRLQYLITNSFYAKALAVKRVVSNRGKKTPGIDGEFWKSDKEKVNAVRSLDCQTYHAKPLKGIYRKVWQERKASFGNTYYERPGYAGITTSCAGTSGRNNCRQDLLWISEIQKS